MKVVVFKFNSQLSLIDDIFFTVTEISGRNIAGMLTSQSLVDTQLARESSAIDKQQQQQHSSLV